MESEDRETAAREAWAEHNDDLVYGVPAGEVERYRLGTNRIASATPEKPLSRFDRHELMVEMTGPLAEMPDHDIYTEQAVLGSMLLDPEAADYVLSRCDWRHFYREPHQMTFLAARKLMAESKPVDLITVSSKLREGGVLDDCGGPEYLMAMMGTVPTTAHVNAYIMILNECLIRRLRTALACRMAEGESDAAGRLSILLEEAQAYNPNAGLQPLGNYDLGGGMEKHLQQTRFEHGPYCGPHTDIPALDELLGALPVPGLVIVRGDTKEGKSALALQALAHWCLPTTRCINGQTLPTPYHGRRGVLVTLEMDTETQVGPRLARMICPPMASEEQLHDAVALAICAPVHVMDEPGSTVEYISAELRRLKRSLGDDFPQLVVVDYLQLVQSAVVSEERFRYQRTCEVLKRMGKELNCCVVLPSQITYSEDGQDVHEFGARFAGFTADRIIRIRRPGQSGPERQQSREATLIVTNRDGAGGEVEVEWDTVRFWDPNTSRIRSNVPFPATPSDPDRGW